MDKQTIRSWFRRGKKPTQAQFWTVFDSYRHIDDRLTMSDIEGLMMALATKSNEGHTHTLAEITDYQSQEKEVINSRVAANQEELDDMDLVDGMKYILLSDETLYVCTYNEDTEELELNEDTPSPNVIYSAEDAAHDMKIYLYNAATLLFQDVTGQEVDKTIYTSDLDSLITRQLNNGIYSVVHINSGDDNNTYGDAYTLTVGDGSIACRILECRTGWAQAQLVDDSYQWKWHRYSYEGHTHEMSGITGLIEALAGKAAVAHNHVLTDITGLEDALATKAAAVHTHIMADITGLNDALAGKAGTDHTHPVDSALSDSSNNPVKNKVVKAAIDWLTAKYQELVTAIDELLFLKSITYAELKELRDNGELRPGRRYRITDYITTIANDSEARSAEHPFDLIVLALSNDTLAEEAHAIRSSRDTDGYFDNAKLNAWKVWYCIDNDTTRFAWADPDDGTGVIYRMIDEWGNDCPYDFKNVQFKRYMVEDNSPNGELADLDGRYIGYGADMMNLNVPDNNDFVWRYTFTNTKDDINTDLTLNPYAYNPEEDYTTKQNGVGNIIQPTYCSVRVDDEIIEGVMALNNIVFLEGFDGAYQGTWGNEIKGRCVNMTFMSGSSSNIIESDNFNIIAGLRFLGNHIGVGGTMFSFSDNCYYNTFGNGCGGNTFGNYCYRNTFGNYFQNNTFGNGCCENTFGNYCYRNTFGNGCGGNTFGNYCRWNTFGNYCYRNTFGNGCGGNTFGNYCRTLTIFDGVQYVSVTGGSSNSDYVQNAQILNGTCGSGSDDLLEISFDENANYTQMAGLNSDGELRVWTPADMV